MATPPKSEPLDLRCDADPKATCAGECPDLPAWVPAADGSGDFDALAQLGPQDRATLAQCRAKLRACQACLRRGREAGAIR